MLLKTFRGFVGSKTPYCRSKSPFEPFWPARCHRAFQNDARTLKRGCSSSPRNQKCAPKWHSGLPQSRHGHRKCCLRPPRNRQCSQKCCPGVLQSRQTTQKQGPSLHHGEKKRSIQLRGRFAIERATRHLCFLLLRSSCFLFPSSMLHVFPLSSFLFSFLCVCVSLVFVSVSLFLFAVVFTFACVFR